MSAMGSDPPLTGRVLVVDDDQVVRTFVRRILEHEGHRVTTAESLSAARAALDGELDVAVLDVDLPDGEGFELVQLLRERSSNPTPIVMITGNPGDDTLAKSSAQGVDEFLFKPFRGDDLTQVIGRALEAKARWHGRLAALDATPGAATLPKPTDLAPEQAIAATREPLLDELVRDHALTLRERDVLEQLIGGLQNSEIAERLGISANTVKYHVRNLLMKLGVESRTALFRSLVKTR